LDDGDEKYPRDDYTINFIPLSQKQSTVNNYNYATSSSRKRKSDEDADNNETNREHNTEDEESSKVSKAKDFRKQYLLTFK
jgi:hypothetical protein